MWSSASSKELRMSLPITAVGPLNVETKPILMLSAADAGCASAMTPASQNAFFIFTPLLNQNVPPGSVTAPGVTLLRASLSVTCFVRDIASLQQARTDGAHLEPSAHTPAPCTIILLNRPWQEL